MRKRKHNICSSLKFSNNALIHILIVVLHFLFLQKAKFFNKFKQRFEELIFYKFLKNSLMLYLFEKNFSGYKRKDYLTELPLFTGCEIQGLFQDFPGLFQVNPGLSLANKT